MRKFVCLLLAAAGSGWILKADGQNTSFRIDTVAGGDDLGDGGPALSAEFGTIQGIALGRDGTLYLSDTDHHRVRMVKPNGITTTVAGTGVAGFSGDGGTASAAQLNLPYGLAVDRDGSVYVADLGNNRVRRVSPQGLITTVAPNATFGAPRNLAFDADGNLYISEFTGHRVRKVSPDGSLITVAGTGEAGFGGDGNPGPLARLAFPAGLAADPTGALYIADSQNHKIRRLQPDGTLTTILGAVPATALQTPIAITLDRSGLLYVADESSVVRAYSIWGIWKTVAGDGTPGFAGDGRAATAAQLAGTHDLAMDDAGNLYLADGVRVRKVDPDGIIQTVVGDGYSRVVGDGETGPAVRLFHPSSVASDRAGNLYFADTGTQRVRKMAPSGQIETYAGTGTAGYSGDGVLQAYSFLDSPRGVAVDANDAVVIADTGSHRIRRMFGAQLWTVAGPGAKPPFDLPLRAPRGVCVGATGALYAVDTLNQRVLQLEPGTAPTIVGSDQRSADTTKHLNQPSACALDAIGNLYIADTLNHRIQKTSSAGITSTVAGTGTPGMGGDEGLAVEASLREPAGVAAGDDGTVYISDTGNHRIRAITPDGVIHTIAGQDAPGFSGDGGPATRALLNAPTGLSIHPSGDLYFADTNNNRIRRLTREPMRPPVSVGEVVNAASLLPGPVAPGEILTVLGSGLGPEQGSQGTFGASGQLATSIGSTEVRFDGIAAPLFYADSRQITVQAPYTLSGKTRTRIEISYNGQNTARDLAVVESAPALFPVVSNEDGTPNSAAEPAPRGTIVTLFGTGEGVTDGANVSGQLAVIPYPAPILPMSLTIAGVKAELLYAGSAPAAVGLFQVNARVPAAFVPPGGAAVLLQVGTAIAPPLTIWLK